MNPENKGQFTQILLWIILLSLSVLILSNMLNSCNNLEQARETRDKLNLLIRKMELAHKRFDTMEAKMDTLQMKISLHCDP